MEDHLEPDPDDEHPKREVVIILAVFFEFGLAPLSLILGRLSGHLPLKTFEWSPDAVIWGVAATIPLIVMSLGMLRWPIGPLARVKEFCDYEVVPLLEKSSWSDIALISLSAGVGEEMLFRGVVQASLTDWLQSWLGASMGASCGLGLASALFGILHPISVPYMVVAAILGLYLGAVWILNGNLLTVMITHALYDFAALAYLLRIRPRGGVSSIST
jgi:uncharacterized protein